MSVGLPLSCQFCGEPATHEIARAVDPKTIPVCVPCRQIALSFIGSWINLTPRKETGKKKQT
jgi:hypothetical protein